MRDAGSADRGPGYASTMPYILDLQTVSKTGRRQPAGRRPPVRMRTLARPRI